MNKKLYSIASLLVVASMLLAACAPASTPGTPPPPVIQTVVVQGTPVVVVATPAPPAAPTTKTLVVNTGGSGDIPTIDPALTTDTSSVQVVDETTVGLTRQNEVSTAVEPGMATKWDISADGLTYTFHLRTDVPWVKWDNGAGQVVKVQTCPDANGKTTDRMVTAQDFEYGILRTLNPKTASGYAYVLTSVMAGANDYNSGTITDTAKVGVKALDASTLQVTFVAPAAYNANNLGMWVAHAQPSWLIDGDDCTQAKGDRWTETGAFQGYGPYTLKEWVHDSSLTMIKNPFWPGSDAVPQAKIDEVVTKMLDAEPAFSDYEAGLMDVTSAPLSAIDRIKSDPVLSKQYTVAPVLCTYYYGFNTKAPFVDDVRVRLALSEAVDRQGLIDNVTKGGQEPAQWMSRPGLAGAPTMKDHPDLGVKYNPTDAKALLDAYMKEKNLTPDKIDITLVFNTSSGHQKIAEAIQQMWKTNLGINVKLANQEWKVFLTSIRDPKNTPQIWRLGWCQDYPDANNFTREVFSLGSSANPKGGGGINVDNPAFEKLMVDAASEQDPAKRVELYAQVEDQLVKQIAAIIPIYWYTSGGMTKPYINRTFSVLGGLEHFEKWDVDMAAKMQK